MKIREVNAPEMRVPKKFEDVDIGEAFRIGGIIAVKVEGFYDADIDLSVNAINLRNGTLLCASDSAEVEVYVGELVFDERDWRKWEWQ